jgi:hypothetical protein
LSTSINTADFDFYTYRFINPDGKTTTTAVPDNLVVCKKVPEASDKSKAKRRRESSKSQDTMDTEKPKRRSKKTGEQLIPVPVNLMPDSLAIHTQNLTIGGIHKHR